MKLTPVERAVKPFTVFFQQQSSSGVVLILAALLAFALANSPASESYFHFIETPLKLGVGDFELKMSLHHFINDALMAIFFFLVGLEIKREILVGELRNFRQAAWPILAALGGAIVPALIFIAFNRSGDAAKAWGIPMATDIAFALGILALVGPKVPNSAKVFLAALAIIDDLLSVLIIAFVYSSGINLNALWAMLSLVALMLVANKLGLRNLIAYAVLSLALWWATYLTGVHPTIAGVLAAITIPATSRISSSRFHRRAGQLIEEFAEEGDLNETDELSERQEASIYELEKSIGRALAPLSRLESLLHSWVAFGIMPIFAFANAGVTLGSASLLNPITLGVGLGLVFGKVIGIFWASQIGRALKICAIPKAVTWQMRMGVGWLGGIGFTMSLFIAELALKDPDDLAAAKLGVLIASVVAAVVGFVWLRVALKAKPGTIEA